LWDTAQWAFFLSVVSLLGSAITFVLAELRRWERISIKAELRFRFDAQRDRYLYPTVVQLDNPRTGETCCRLTITYRGRHSVALRSVYYEFANSALVPFTPAMAPCTLYDGQSKRLLMVGRAFDLKDVTGFVVMTDSHGVHFKRVRWFHRFQHDNRFARPWLYWVLQRVTGVPRVVRAADMNPKRCPKCRSRDIRTVYDQLVDTGVPNAFHRTKRFECTKCSHAWSADSIEPERIETRADEAPEDEVPDDEPPKEQPM